MSTPERPVRFPFGGAERVAERETSGARGGTPLQVLILEDSEDDVLLLLDELRRGGYEPLYQRVETPQALEEALVRKQWDIVIADNHMRLFSAADALALVRQKRFDLPFILTSDKIDEDVAVALMKDSGAHDYVAKDNLSGLGPAIERGLREAEYRRKRRLAEETLREAEAKYRTLFENAVEGIFRSTAEGRIEIANPALARILGYASPDELISCVTDITSQIYADPGRCEEFIEQIRHHGAVSGFEARVLRKDGSIIWVSMNAHAVYDEAGEITGFAGFVENITKRKDAEQTLYESEERFRSLVQHPSDIITTLEPDGTIRYTSPATERILGYRPEELIGQNVFDYVHPDDIGQLTGTTAEILRDSGAALIAEFRFRHSDGSWCFLEAVIRNLSGGDKAGEVAVNARDITERKRIEEELRRSEELYRKVVEQAAENIFLVDVATKRVLEANDAFHRSLGYSAEELQRLTLYDFVAHDRESIDRNVRRSLEEGRSFLGERKYRRKDGSLISVEVSVSPISYAAREAMCVVAHDITEREQTEESLRRTLDALLALREAGQILGSTLESEKIGTKLLEIMRSVSGLTAAVISRQDERGQLRVWRAAGLEGLWSRARYAPEAETARRVVLQTGEQQLFQLRRLEHRTDHLAGLCLPLPIRERIAGVLEAYGPESLAEEDTVSLLSSLAAQAASALENAELYEELAEREKRLEDLVGRLFEAQEEERRRVAYEVHDGLAQIAAAAHQHLQAFARLYPPGSEEAQDLLDRALGWAQQTVGEARRVIADLRPIVLDDFGLQTAIRLEAEALREEGWRVSYKENLGDERLPLAVETALFRIAQEALRNVRKHAKNTEWIRLSLIRSRHRVRLSVRDWGSGFDAEASSLGPPGERVGLSSMRERVALLGGRFRVDSRPGVGTLITVNVPLSERGEAKRERANFG